MRGEPPGRRSFPKLFDASLAASCRALGLILEVGQGLFDPPDLRLKLFQIPLKPFTPFFSGEETPSAAAVSHVTTGNGFSRMMPFTVATMVA